MKQWKKRALALSCALALAVGTAAAAGTVVTKRLEAQYMGIRLMVDGREVTPTDANGSPVEPFAVDGTVYLPVRAVGEALGKDVVWDAETRTVRVGESPYVEDARQLIGDIERSHAAFSLNQVPEGYQAAKDALLAQSAEADCTAADFAWAALAYTASLQDGHTSIDVFGSGAQSVLDIGWLADGDHLYLTDEAGAPTSAEVTRIGSLSVAEVFAAVDRYIVSENQSARDVNHAAWAGNRNILFHIGAAADQAAASVTVVENGKETRRTVPFAVPEAAFDEEPIITSKRLGDVFYIDFNQCIPGPEVDAVAAELAAAVKGGTGKVIIDLRGNGGGDSAAGDQLLEAMGMTAPSYGVYVRYSDLALDEHQPYQRGYTSAEGDAMLYTPDASKAKANPKVTLVVLTDEGTYSSATILGVCVQDGKLGTVIGRASANAPNSFGDILYNRLVHMQTVYTISHRQFQRPDTDANPRVLVPDIETAVGEDALQAALDWMKTH